MKTMEKKGGKTLLMMLIACFVTLVFSSLSSTKSTSEQSLGIRKVSMCHFGKVIKVDQSAVQSHLDHGDRVGVCEPNPPIDL